MNARPDRQDAERKRGIFGKLSGQAVEGFGCCERRSAAENEPKSLACRVRNRVCDGWRLAVPTTVGNRRVLRACENGCKRCLGQCEHGAEVGFLGIVPGLQ
jgi:hypothetical protein